MHVIKYITCVAGKLTIGNPSGARVEFDWPNKRIDVYDWSGELETRLGRLN